MRRPALRRRWASAGLRTYPLLRSSYSKLIASSLGSLTGERVTPACASYILWLGLRMATPSPHPERSPDPPTAAGPPSGFRKFRCLVVDDDAVVCDTILDILTPMLHVETARDGTTIECAVTPLIPILLRIILVATSLPLRWALGGSRGRSRAFGDPRRVNASHCDESRFGRGFRGLTGMRFSGSTAGGWRPSQG